MKLDLYQVDAFARQVFSGNPAAVCPLPTRQWMDGSADALLQNIAAENNLSETSFFFGSAGDYHLRWFTPTTEVRLCGHATMAAAWVIFNVLEPSAKRLRFSTLGGELVVDRLEQDLAMTLPIQAVELAETPPSLLPALGLEASATAEILAGEDWLVLLNEEAEIANLKPDLNILAGVGRRGVCVSAPGQQVDFVSRFFAPQSGIPEDPATGSAHAMLAPIWAERLGKSNLSARQLSERGADFACAVSRDSVVVSGQCQLYLSGQITLPDLD